MYPKIHDFTGNRLETQGYGALSDCISAEVTEVLNGEYTLEIQYPLNGIHAEHLVTGNIIVAKPSHDQQEQAFRIHQVKKSISNSYRVYANHISYDLSGFPIRNALSFPSLETVMINLNSLIWEPGKASFHEFNFDTDMTSAKRLSMPGAQTVRSWMGGQDPSILSVYGGEWIYNNYNCFLTSRRGRDTGYRISYGKNLEAFERQSDYSAYTHVVAYWKKSDTVVTSDYIATDVDGPFRVAYYDASNEYENQPSVAQLNTSARSQILKMNFGAQTITVTPAQIGNDLIGLGDGVLVCYDTVFNARVVKTVWDVIANKYKSLELGQKKEGISDTIKSLSTGTSAVSSEGGGGGGSSGIDYIIEEGTSGNWSYRKWESGIMECWGWKTFSVVVNQKWGSLYYATVTAENFPTAFSAIPELVFHMASGGAWTTGTYSLSASSTGYFYVMRPDTGNTVNGRVHYYAIGKWK